MERRHHTIVIIIIIIIIINNKTNSTKKQQQKQQQQKHQQQQQQRQGPHLGDAPSLGTGETSTCQTHQTSSPAPKVLDKLNKYWNK